jgi:hypothetical protein
MLLPSSPSYRWSQTSTHASTCESHHQDIASHHTACHMLYSIGVFQADTLQPWHGQLQHRSGQAAWRGSAAHTNIITAVTATASAISLSIGCPEQSHSRSYQKKESHNKLTPEQKSFTACAQRCICKAERYSTPYASSSNACMLARALIHPPAEIPAASRSEIQQKVTWVSPLLSAPLHIVDIISRFPRIVV